VGTCVTCGGSGAICFSDLDCCAGTACFIFAAGTPGTCF
jgi:hypothetical protein